MKRILPLLLVLLAAPFAHAAADTSEADLSASVFRLRSTSSGTAFVIMRTGNTAYFVTALHVLTGADGGKPSEAPCNLDHGSKENGVACQLVFPRTMADITRSGAGAIDLAIVSADVSSLPSQPKGVAFGTSMSLTGGSKMVSYGYPTGQNEIQRTVADFSSSAPPASFLLASIRPVEGQSGSPLFDSESHKVVGMIIERGLHENDMARAQMIDSVAIALRSMAIFRGAIQINIPQATAVGPYTAAEGALSIKSAFDNIEPARRWYDRAKYYQRTDAEAPWVADENGWMGLQRTYVSSRNNSQSLVGRGWVHAYQYTVDTQSSTLCSIHVINSKGQSEYFKPLQDCDQAKKSLAADVPEASALDQPLANLLADDHLRTDALPKTEISYIGAELGVSRARFIKQGMQINVGAMTYWFNPAGKMIHVKSPTADIDLSYDERGRLIQASDLIRTMRLAYDDRHLVRLTFNDGSSYEYAYSPDGELTEITMAGQVIKQYKYNAEHRLTHVSIPADASMERTIAYSDGLRASVSTPDSKYQWEFIEDDGTGTAIVHQKIYAGTELSEARDYVFAADHTLAVNNGDLSKVYKLTICMCLPLEVARYDYVPGKDGADGHRVGAANLVSTFKYDPFGRLTFKQDRLVSYRLQYDETASKVSAVEVRYHDTDEWKPWATFKYNAFNFLQSASSGEDTVTLDYDSHRRISTLSSKDTTLTFTYNVIGKPTRIEIPKVGWVSFTYKSNGEIDKLDSGGGDPNDGGSSPTTTVMHKLQSLIDITTRAQVDTDTEYSNIDYIPGDRKCACALE